MEARRAGRIACGEDKALRDKEFIAACNLQKGHPAQMRFSGAEKKGFSL
jgi:hypothetical protein